MCMAVTVVDVLVMLWKEIDIMKNKAIIEVVLQRLLYSDIQQTTSVELSAANLKQLTTQHKVIPNQNTASSSSKNSTLKINIMEHAGEAVTIS